MKIATWNVNSVKARLPNVLAWLERASPDVVLFQEIKCETASFPKQEFEALGYCCAVVGQKSYNGVALLSKQPAEDVLDHLPGDAEDTQGRYVEATVAGVRIASLYLPNGNPVGTEKYPYKLRWMERLRRHAAELLKTEQPFVLGGDYNVIPAPEDVYDPQAWETDALFRPETRAQFRALLNLGLTEAFRAVHPDESRAYTFWDYQAGRWPRDQGIRIDHFLLSPQAADRLVDCRIDRGPRGEEKASDHTPVVLELAD
ncbi:exodeoxyribonuclease III [Skermanella rosea]|uniref:exodeoxyribonuclease III n=1 Tax=Skermanella rosea TaxID=1817965 RepID=UPI001931F0EA|nr:exodeoxyribonuclease III [Skermanella rosea]UEM05451.1 exodeoxyribonuclease III [Skermanella rosea]